jgi:hypothetical protein
MAALPGPGIWAMPDLDIKLKKRKKKDKKRREREKIEFLLKE